jgi:hypothetical protein
LKWVLVAKADGILPSYHPFVSYFLPYLFPLLKLHLQGFVSVLVPLLSAAIFLPGHPIQHVLHLLPFVSVVLFVLDTSPCTHDHVSVMILFQESLNS